MSAELELNLLEREELAGQFAEALRSAGPDTAPELKDDTDEEERLP